VETEKIKIVDKNLNEIGVAERQEVHRNGFWHETFHCWFISLEKQTNYIYFQLRSPLKKDYPNLLDITAAGHLLADETVNDGIREVKEELGIDLGMEELINLGIIEHSLTEEDFLDNEFCHVFLYYRQGEINGFELQTEEVAGIMKARFSDFKNLWLGSAEEIRMAGFVISEDGTQTKIDKYVGKNQFIPNTARYFETFIRRCQEHLKNEPF